MEYSFSIHVAILSLVQCSASNGVTIFNTQEKKIDAIVTTEIGSGHVEDLPLCTFSDSGQLSIAQFSSIILYLPTECPDNDK